MNKTILNPKKQFLLGAGLDVLHFESREWLDTIAFWKDEVKFFDHLLKRKETSNKNNNPEYKKMLINLEKIYTDLFEGFEDNIIEHEQLLSRIELAEKGLSDNDYREKHRKISSKITSFKVDFKIFKSIVFEYVKGL